MARFASDRYELETVLSESPAASVHRARDLDTGDMVTLTIYRDFDPEQGDQVLDQYRKSTIYAKLQHPQIVRHITFGRWKNTYYLVQEYSEGRLLSSVWQEPQWSIAHSIQAVLQVAEALDYCHNLGLIHLGVRPGNITILTDDEGALPKSPEEVQVRLLGVGESTLLVSCHDARNEPVEHMFYMSPEQMGILNKRPDHRSDIYSLGTVLYHALSGRVPYAAPDAVSLAHQLVARMPSRPEPQGVTIPDSLHEVVLRAIEKNPGDRFHSMEEFGSELRAAEEEFRPVQIPGPTGAFAVRTQPAGEDRLPLVEREVELQRLCALFEKARMGVGSFVLVTGPPGSGKTRLIEEFRDRVLKRQGLFLWSQATEFESNRPYSPLREAIGQFVHYSRQLPERSAAVLRRRIEAAVGNFGKELLRTVPEIEELLPSMPDLVSLEPERGQQRSTKTLLKLLCALSSQQVPAVLFIDDYNFVDRGTRDIVRKLRGYHAETNLILVCTESQLEIEMRLSPSSPPGDPTEGAEQLRIHLNRISQDGCRRLLREALPESDAPLDDLATVAHERCGGNLTLLHGIIKTLRLEAESLDKPRTSKADLLRLQTLIPETEVAVSERHFKELSDRTREIISAAAVVGRKFSRSLLEKLLGLTEEEIRVAIAEGIEGQVIGSWSAFGSDWHCFSQQRVHEEIRDSIRPERRLELHRRIAECLESEAGDDDSRIYEIALHHLRGDDPEKARASALRAALAAKEAYANQEAIYFFSETLDRLPAKSQGPRLEILENLGDAYALDGRYEDAEPIYRRVLEAAEDPPHKARLEGKVGDMHFRRGQNEAAIEHLARGLRWLGFRSPRTKVGLWWSVLRNLAVRCVRAVLPRSFYLLEQDRHRRKAEEAVRIFHSLAYAYYFLDIPHTLEVHLRQLNLAERLGDSRELANTYSSHGIVCSLIPLHMRAIRYQQVGLEMRKRLGDRWGIGQSYAFLGVCYYYRSEISQAIEYLKQSVRILESMGDQWEIEAAYSHLGFCYRLLGEIEAAEEIHQTLLRLSLEIHDLKFIAIAQTGLAECQLVRGNLDRAMDLVEKALRAGGDHFTRAMAMRAKAQILLGLGRTDDALEVLSESLALIREHNLHNEYLVSNHIAFAEALLKDVDKILVMGNSERRRYLRRARRYVNKGLRLAQKFRNHLGYALRVRASYHRLCGQPSRAEWDFARSEEVLRDGGRVYELGLTLFEKARWRSREGDLTDFEDLERAIEYFRKVGARRDLEKAWGILGLKNTGDDREQRLRSEHHQLSSLFKMSRTISSILDLNRLVSQITDLAVEVTGGERGYLFLSSSRHDGLPEVRCARDMDRQDIEHDLAPAIEELVKKTWQSGVPQFASFLTPGYTRECSMIAVPLRAGEETFGLIYVENNLTRDLYSQEDVEFLTAFASQAAISLQNASLYQKAEELNLSLENKVQARTRELLESKQQLEYANRLKSEFLANMSHELRTPLNAVIAMSEILIERTFGDLTEKQEIYATQILDAGVHLLSLINDVLDLSKVEAGQLELDVAAFNLEDVLKRSLLVVKERAAKHRISLELRHNSSVDVFYGDARRIKQTVLNLLTNAVKFTPEGGRVRIEARDEDDEVIVCISDTGIGISEDNLEIIFDEFRQVDSSLSRRFEGTGLGLALCKKFVKLHGGRIWAESEEGLGSRFYFTIPHVCQHTAQIALASQTSERS